MIKALFQKSINVVEHGFNASIYKKLHNFVSKEAHDIIGIDSSTCHCTLRVTYGLPCACELDKFISIYDFIPLKSIHVHWKMLSICSSNDIGDSWGNTRG